MRFPTSLSPRSEERLHPYLALIARHWAFVLVALVVGGLVGFGLSQLAPKGYSASSTLYFSINYGDSGSDLNQGSTYAQSQMLSFAELARSARVLDPVIDQLELDTTTVGLASMIDARTPENTVVLDIVAESGDPELAAAIANATAVSLTEAVQDVAPRNDAGRATVTVRTVEKAVAPTTPVSPNTRVNVVAGALLGLVSAILAIALRRLLDTRIRTDRSLREATGLPVFASVVDDPNHSEGPVFARGGEAAESYRRLRTSVERLRHASKRAPASRKATSIALVAPTVGQGTSTVSSNLALALAEAGHAVVLVGPGHSASDGVTALWGFGKSGSAVTVSAASTLIAAQSAKADVVIIDVPSIATSADILSVGPAVDAVFLVASARSADSGQVRSALDQLAAASISIHGSVLTQAHTPRTKRLVARREPAVAPRPAGEKLPALEHN